MGSAVIYSRTRQYPQTLTEKYKVAHWWQIGDQDSLSRASLYEQHSQYQNPDIVQLRQNTSLDQSQFIALSHWRLHDRASLVRLLLVQIHITGAEDYRNLCVCAECLLWLWTSSTSVMRTKESGLIMMHETVALEYSGLCISYRMTWRHYRHCWYRICAVVILGSNIHILVECYASLLCYQISSRSSSQ